MLAAINNDIARFSAIDEERNVQSNPTTLLELLLQLFSQIENMSHEFGNSEAFSPALAEFFSSISGLDQNYIDYFFNVPMIEFENIMASLKCTALANAKCNDGCYQLNVCYFGGLSGEFEELKSSQVHSNKKYPHKI